MFEVAPAGVAGEDDLAPPKEMAWMRRLAAEIGRPVTFGMTQSNVAPGQYRELLAEAAAAAAEGATVVPQVAGRASGLLFGLGTTYHPFANRPTFAALADLPRAEQVARLRLADTRAAILAEGNGQASASLLDQFGDRTWPFDESCDYEPPVESSIDARARREGRRPDEVLYDLQLQHDGAQLFMVPILNYADNTFEPLREMLEHSPYVAGFRPGARGEGGDGVTIVALLN